MTIRIINKRPDYHKIIYKLEYEGPSPSNDEVYAALNETSFVGSYINDHGDGTMTVDIYTE